MCPGPLAPALLSEEFESCAGELCVEREDAAVFFVGTILSLSPLATSTGWWITDRSEGCSRPQR